MVQTHYAIGIDIGGGSTKIGLVSSQGEIIDKQRLVIDRKERAETIVQSYAAIIRTLCDRYQQQKPIGIGIGFPGFVYPNNLVGRVSNIPPLDDYPLAENLGQLFSCPTRMENDATAACTAESLYGENRELRRLMLVTAGTGIGVAMTIDDRPLVTAGSCLGDAGHLILALDAPCHCRQGCLGCLESVASGHALNKWAAAFAVDNPDSILARHARILSKVPDASDVIHCAHQGDKRSIAILAQIGTWLGQATASWCHILLLMRCFSVVA